MGLFKKKKQIPQRTLDDIKQVCRIVFIDDREFPIMDILKGSGWNNIQRLPDVYALDQLELRDAHILFVDIQGVGKILNLPNEGLDLIAALKIKYPHKKVIAYSGEDQGQVQAFHKGLDMADSRLSKNAASYEFQFKLEKYAKETFSLEECIERISRLLVTELGNSPGKDEIIKKLEKIHRKKGFRLEDVSEIFNLQNAANLTSVIQMFLNG